MPVPTEVILHKQSRQLEIAFDDGARFHLPLEFLRVSTPSAEARGHGPGQEVLQIGKRDVSVTQLEAVGHYAIQPRFSDGHDTGIYSWDYLYHLGQHQDELWRDYLARLEAAGASRDAPESGSASPIIASSGHAASPHATATAGGCGKPGCGSGGCGQS